MAICGPRVVCAYRSLPLFTRVVCIWVCIKYVCVCMCVCVAVTRSFVGVDCVQGSFFPSVVTLISPRSAPPPPLQGRYR